MNRLPICIRTSQDYRTRLFVPALLRAFSRAQDCFRYDWHLAEKFDVAELECLRIDFQLGIRVLRWELKFNIDLRLELCLLLPMNFNITLAFGSRGSAFVSSTAFAAFASRLTRLGAV